MATIGARILVVDDPWLYHSRHAIRRDNPGKKPKFGVGCSGHYSLGVMTEEALIDLGEAIRGVCAPDVYGFFWATRPNMDTAFRVLAGRGFEYKQMPFSWEKLYPNGESFKGTGRYTFGNKEDVQFGHLPPEDPFEDTVEDVILGRLPKTRCWHPNTGYRPQMPIRTVHPQYLEDPYKREDSHSIKPEVLQDELDKWLDPYLDGGLKVELFATRRRPGWLCLGFDTTGRPIHEDLAILETMIILDVPFVDMERRLYGGA